VSARSGSLLFAASLVIALPLGAQDTVVVIRQGRTGTGTAAERRALAVFNASGTIRIVGADTIASSEALEGDVAVLDGPLRVDGTIRGDLVAINAVVVLAAGAVVEGDVLIVGGAFEEHPDARIDGALELHRIGPRVRWVGERLELVESRRPGDRPDHRLPRSYPTARASLELATGGIYNRVEGVPVHIGPRVSWATWDTDLRLDGLVILRTGAGSHFGGRSVGYRVSGRLRLGAGRTVELGARVFDELAPIEDWQLRTDEVGWASFLFHRDYRDYYLGRGIAGTARVRVGPVLAVSGGVAWTDATSIAAGAPWTLFRNDEPWRANPIIDDGKFTTLTGGIELDTRAERRWGGGVRLAMEWEYGIGSDLVPRDLPTSVRKPIPLDGYRYDRVWGDLRLYVPLAGGGFALRAVGGGEVGDNPLPVQRRLSLGGPDPMPGFGFRQFACNEAAADPATPALCDRLFVVQAEFRTGLGFGWPDWDDDHEHDEPWHVWHAFEWDDPHFVLFADGGDAWLRKDGPGTFRWDLGVGLSLGGFGVYVARGVGPDDPIQGILRLHQRF